MPFLIGSVGIDSDIEGFESNVPIIEQELEIRIPNTCSNIIPYLKNLLKNDKQNLQFNNVYVMSDKEDKYVRHEYHAVTKKYIRTTKKTINKMVNKRNEEKDCYVGFDDYYGPYCSSARMLFSTETSNVMNNPPDLIIEKAIAKIRVSKTLDNKRYDFTARINASEFNTNTTIENYLDHPIDFELEFLHPSLALFKEIRQRYYNFVDRYTFDIPVIDDIIFNTIVHVNYWFIALRVYNTESRPRYYGSINNMLNKAKDIMYSNIIDPNTSLLLSKTDGVRTLLFIVNNYIILTNQNVSYVYKITSHSALTNNLDKLFLTDFGAHRTFKYTDSYDTYGNSYWRIVIDGELVTKDKDTGIFIAFDCLHNRSESINYTERLSGIRSIINPMIQSVVHNYTLAIKNAVPFSKKGFKDCHKQLKDTKNKTITGLPDDGVIIISDSTQDYYNTENLKWKEHYTVDLYYLNHVLYCTDSIETINSIYINHKILSPFNSVLLQNTSTYKHTLDNHSVYEFKINDQFEFEHIKKRQDKLIPNHKNTIENCVFNTLYPITIDSLMTSSGYFADDETSRTNYFNSVRVTNNLIKNDIYNEYFDNIDTLIDLGSGRGQDLSRYYKSNINTVYMIDNDVPALLESMTRFYKRNNLNINANTNIVLIKHSFNNSFDDVHRLNPSGFIVCNYALHYFDTNESIVNFLQHYWKGLPGSVGYFAFTVFDSIKLKELFMKQKSITFDNDSIVIKSIKNGQFINVKLPFTDNKFYTERLIDVDELLEQCNDKLMNVSIVRRTNNTRSGAFKQHEPNSNNFTELYTQVVFRKQF